MATDAKRMSGPPKIPVATPNIGASPSTVPLETALVGSIGARIRVTTTFNKTLEGTLFVADPITNLVVINTAPPPPTPAASATAASLNQPGDYNIIAVSKVQSFQLVSLGQSSGTETGSTANKPHAPTSFDQVVPSIRNLDLAALQAREKAAVEREQARERSRGKGVSQLAQDIYDALSRTLPLRWHEQTIIVSDAVMISPPYTPEDCKAAQKDRSALQRVKKVLEMERKKIVDRSNTTTPTPTNAAKTGEKPTQIRKGG